MPLAIISAIATILTEAPTLIAGGEAVWNDLATAIGLLAKHGVVTLPADQLASMNQAVATSLATTAALQAAAAAKPA